VWGRSEELERGLSTESSKVKGGRQSEKGEDTSLFYSLHTQ